MFSEQMLPVKECYEVGICSGVLKDFILKSYQTKLVVDGIFTTLSLWLGGRGVACKVIFASDPTNVYADLQIILAFLVS